MPPVTTNTSQSQSTDRTNTEQATGRGPSSETMRATTERTTGTTRLTNTRGVPEQETVTRRWNDFEQDNRTRLERLTQRDPAAADKLKDISLALAGRGGPSHLSRDDRIALIDGSNRLRELEQLLPLLEQNPELLDHLHNLATSERLFGIGRGERGLRDAEFERMRSEYMIDLVRFAANRELITQGPGSLCTAATAMKYVSSAELLRLGCVYGCRGEVRTVSGASMSVRPEFYNRAVEARDGELSTIKSQRRSVGFHMLLDGVMVLGGVPVNRLGQGSYWYQYTHAVRHLTGRDVTCVFRDGEMHADPRTGRLVAGRGASPDQTLGQWQLLVREVDRLSGRGERHAGGQGVIIDTRYRHNADSNHGRHQLLVTGFRRDDSGRIVSVICENPIGAYMDTRNPGRTFPVGTELGETDSANPLAFRFRVGRGNTIEIAPEVLQQHLRTIIVDTDEEYRAETGSLRPRHVGTAETTSARWVDADWDRKSATDLDIPVRIIEENNPIEGLPETEYQPASQDERAYSFSRERASQLKWWEDKDGDDILDSAENHGVVSIAPVETVADQRWDPDTGTWITETHAAAPTRPSRSRVFVAVDPSTSPNRDRIGEGPLTEQHSAELTTLSNPRPYRAPATDWNVPTEQDGSNSPVSRALSWGRNRRGSFS